MKRAPYVEGKLLADLHAHLANYKSEKETLEILCSPGIVGLSLIDEENCSYKILTYEQAYNRFSNLIKEIDKGQLAKISSENGEGYFLRSQEITGKNHILAFGFEGDYLFNYSDPRKAVEEIHKKKGIAILNHPYVITENYGMNPLKDFRYPNAKEESELKELLDMVDEVEIFNSQCINLLFGILIPNFKKANLKAEKLIENSKFKGTVSSDAHYRIDQPKICGIYISDDNICLDKIKDSVKTGNFDNKYRQYASRITIISKILFERNIPKELPQKIYNQKDIRAIL